MPSVTICSPEDMVLFAERLAGVMTASTTILLDGELGAGKTTFTKGLAKGLGVDDMIKSPTYTFVKEYPNGRLPLYHMDVYRLEGIGGEGLGFEEYFESDGVCVVEWAQFIAEQLPSDYLMIRIARVLEEEMQRVVSLEAFGKKAHELLQNIEENGLI